MAKQNRYYTFTAWYRDGLTRECSAQSPKQLQVRIKKLCLKIREES